MKNAYQRTQFHPRFFFTVSLMMATLIAVAGDHVENRSEWLLDTLPQNWVLEQQYFMTTPNEDRWWHEFNDPVLVALIQKGVTNNYDVQMAARRIEMAHQTERATKAGYYPTVNLAGNWTREMTASTVHGEHPHEQSMSYFQLGLAVNWEIDLFGRIKQQLKADRANYYVSVEDYNAAQVSLCSNLAKAYFQLRLAQEQVKIAEANVAIVEKQKVLADARYEAGLRPLLDEVQARMSVVQTRATLPQLRANVRTYLNQVALLVGEYPDKLEYLLEDSALPSTPEPGNVADPQALLRRRPDIVSAEQQLAATAAQIGIAKKDFLPTLSVTAHVGTQAHTLSQIFSNNAYYYTVLPTLTWTVFDGMARNAKLAQARLQMESQIDSYNLTVMTAVSEVNNAMLSWQSIGEQIIYQEMILKDARKQLELQTDRYLQGLNGFSDIAGAQAQVLQYENSLIQLKASQLAAIVTLYTALGGGF